MKIIDYDTQIYNTIRKNIKRCRLEKGITSAELAEMVDLSHDFIRQIESDKVANSFSVETLYRISKALDVPIDELVKKEDKEKIVNWDYFSLYNRKVTSKNNLKNIKLMYWHNNVCMVWLIHQGGKENDNT